MIVHVKMFALAAELAGGDAVEIELPAEATVADLRRALAEAYPEFAGIVGHVMFAIDAGYATDTAKIPADAQIACIPPVSGG